MAERSSVGSAEDPDAFRLAALASVVAYALHRESVELDENLWDAGLHSLLAARLVVSIRDLFGAELDIAALYHRPTVRELAEVVFAGGGST